MPTRNDDTKFKEFIQGQIEPPTDLLDSTIDWIRSNLSPGDVFDENSYLNMPPITANLILYFQKKNCKSGRKATGTRNYNS